MGARLDTFLPGGDRKNTAFRETGIWMFVIGLPAVGTIGSLFWYARSYLRIVPAALSRCIAGLVIFASGAMGMETLGNFVEGSAFTVAIAAEELGEMLGITTVLWGILELLQVRGVRLESSLSNHDFSSRIGKSKI